MSTIKTGTTLTTAYSVTGDTTGTLVVQTGSTPTTAVTFGSDQSVTMAGKTTNPSTISVGGATPSASGAGITFPATQSASSDANTLDDYEEGTFTPSVAFGGASVGVTYGANRLGSYTKIGRFVYGALRITLTSAGSSTGSATITGLPFNCVNTEGYNGGVWEAYCGNMASWGVPKMFIIDINTNIITLRYAAGVTGTALTNTNFNNNSDLILNFCYQVQ